MQARWRWSIGIVLIFISLPFLAFAQSGVFNERAANRTLDKLNIGLSIQKFNIDKIKEAIDVLVVLKEEAQDCVKEGERELAVINKTLESVTPSDVETKIISPEQKYLLGKKSELDKDLSACRLFELRSKEVISAFNEVVQKHVASELFKKEPTAWHNLVESFSYFPKVYGLYNWQVSVQNSGFLLLSGSSILIVGILLILLFSGAMAVQRKLRQYISMETPKTFSGKAKQALMSVIASNIILGTCLFMLSVYMTWMSHDMTPTPYLTLLSYALLFFMLFRALAQFFFYPPSPAQGVRDLPRPLSKTLYYRLYIFASLLLFGYCAFIFMQGQNIPDSLWFILRTIFMTLVSIALISVIWLVNRTQKLLSSFRGLRVGISLVLALGLVIILVTEWLGYHQLAEFILFAISQTLVFTLFAWLIYKLLIAALDSMNAANYRWQQSIHNNLGLKRGKAIPELVWLRLVVYLSVWGGLILLLLSVWGLSDVDIRSIHDAIVDGFQFASFYIIPSRILTALVLFTVLVTATRWTRHHLVKSKPKGRDRGAQEAIATIVGYVGFSLSFLLVMLIAGVNFTGLAIIAGALSVGIGFGLQSIVNNFVSGLVLLVERPIKYGDRIQVGDVEGVVKKIRIRSTQIQTNERSDVIVPNSELVSGQVTNLMYKDKHWRVIIKVGVAYGSDTDLVKKTLREVAESHPQIVQDDEKNKPMVLFRNFGDSTLNFELWCMLKDVNLKYEVPSELHSAIDRAFRQHDIEIAFPQRDVHIKPP